MSRKIKYYFLSFCLLISGLSSFRLGYAKALKSKRINKLKSDILSGKLTWKEIEERNQNAVVQLFVQAAPFNWIEPYRAPDQAQGAGSGFFIDEEGHILTNYHVVRQSRSIYTFIPALGKQILDANIVGVFPEGDIALLKLTPSSLSKVKAKLVKLSYVELGDSDKLYTTSPVLAMGYPMGQRYIKCTSGEIAGREFIDNFAYFHVTAPINKGNSGGPLFDDNGKVVGINSAGIENAQNIGYSIPINNVKIFLNKLKHQKLVRKPRLGIITNPTTEEHARLLNNPWPCGVYINNVVERTNAHQAGIKPGDILYSINNYIVDEYGDLDANWGSSGKIALEEYLSRLAIGTPMHLQVYRNGKKLNFNFTFEESGLYNLRMIYPEWESQDLDYEMLGGICVMQLKRNHLDLLYQNNPDLNNYKSLKNINKEALIITHIIPGSVIQRSDCLYTGQIITEVNGKAVKNLKGFRDIIKNNVKSGLLSIKTENNIHTVFSIDKILKEEENLSMNFSYRITPFTYDLIQSNIK